MIALLVSFFIIVAAELGDKTQLIALCLASRFRKPVPIILGILAATLASHFMAAFIGQWIGSLLHEKLLHGLLGLSFFAAAIWALIPDKVDCDTDQPLTHKSIFITTFITFFIAEIGDKTQLATVALAAHFQSFVWVVVGTTLGMMAANIPAVLLSHAITTRIPLKLVRVLSGIAFAVLGIYECSKIWHF